ncbi:MAG TPA: PP2C family protein-serine/threonine phosphatase [Anaerolineae bacterium]|nr:PP2C family protein-serine/threonine phosphatase [Anaerolineae bacterium]HQI86993.1 PP2C family protein-serine/threonine phosphatase [Anaerolineae bacterium]
MHLSVAASKINKWAVRESGDTLEMIERPHGGISFVLADGQSSGEAAKAISIRVVRKVVSELAEGVRDGAAARAANDMLYELRRGKVSATLVILSVDLDSDSLVITQCGNSGVYVRRPGSDLELLESESPALGFYQHTRPTVDQIYLEPGLIALAFTDGLIHAGAHAGEPLDIPTAFEKIWQRTPTAQAVADGLLERAMEADQGRPRDDTSIVVLHIQSGVPEGPRYMRVEVPVPDNQ